MEKSLRSRGLLGAAGLLCLALTSGPVRAQGAGPELQDQQRQERRNQRPQRQHANPERERPPQAVPQQRSQTERRRDDNNRRDGRSRGEDRHDGPPRWTEDRWRGPAAPDAYRRHVYVDTQRYDVRHDRRRVYRNVVVLRPYGGWYNGYGRHHSDRDAYRWLGFTAITFAILSSLNEAQQRALESAQITATTAPIGAPIFWYNQGAQGSVVATRDGWSDAGRYCREFQQTVEIAGRTEQAYGTACEQPDGAWLITSR